MSNYKRELNGIFNYINISRMDTITSSSKQLIQGNQHIIYAYYIYIQHTDRTKYYELIYNIAIGYNSLNTLTTFGQNSTGENIAIGTEAQFSNGASVGGSGDENVAIGHRALYANTGYDGVGTYEGMYNVAVGGKSLEDVNQGDRNTAIGHNSGNTITLGYSNCFVAVYSIKINTWS